MTARITKPAQDALGRASLLEQVRLSREAELSRLRAISGPQPHRPEWMAAMERAQTAIDRAETLALELWTLIDSDAQPHPSAD